jgi:hypothetical protein
MPVEMTRQVLSARVMQVIARTVFPKNLPSRPVFGTPPALLLASDPPRERGIRIETLAWNGLPRPNQADSPISGSDIRRGRFRLPDPGFCPPPIVCDPLELLTPPSYPQPYPPAFLPGHPLPRGWPVFFLRVPRSRGFARIACPIVFRSSFLLLVSSKGQEPPAPHGPSLCAPSCSAPFAR